MSSVTQTIPTLTGGLSQQPDELKIPGQVNVANNVIPDVTHGLLKRPGSKLVASLSDNSTSSLNSHLNGKWFSYYRDETEQYIGQVNRAGDINMWRCSDGAAMTVNYTSSIASQLTSYLTHTNDEDIQTLTLNDYTFITNRTKTVEMSTTVEPTRPPEVFIDLKSIAYARQYAVNLSDNNNLTTVTTATRINVELVASSNNYCDTDGTMADHIYREARSTRCTSAAQDGRDAYSPNVGTRIFDVDDGKSLVDSNAVGGNGQSQNYSYTVDVKNSSNSSVNRGEKLIFRIRTVGQSVAFTTGATDSGQTTEYQTRYTTTHDLLFGGSGWQQGDYFHVWMKDGKYKVTIEEISTTQVEANLGLIRPNPTPFDTETTLTAEAIIGNLRSEIIATGNFTSANVRQIGNGLYVTRPSGVFNITAPNTDLLKVMAGSVKSPADLPAQCRHGYVVKVTNSEATEDDYYVKFFGENDRDGDGVWEECNEPGRKIEFKASTMPIQLVREASGVFTVNQVSWVNCAVGSNDPPTNPEPSFVGNTINQLVFFRNRLVMLSDENVVMSRPGNFFNFWSRTAQTASIEDVIDLSCSSNYPAIVYDGIQINAGLLLFTKNQQFMLTTDSDILSPDTAKINAVASYNFNIKTNPVSLGTTVGFLDNANKFSRFFEMTNVLRQGEPDVIDQSAVISKLLNKDLDLIAESRENSVIFFTQKGTKTIYGFRYFATGERRLLQAWFTWDVVGDIQYMCMLDDALYVVTRNIVSGVDKDQMVRYPLKLDETGFFVTDTKETTDTNDDVIYRVHLDHMSTVNGATYNAVTKKSTLAKPVGYVYDTAQLVAYDIDAGTDLGRYSLVTVSGSNYIIDGDWSSNNFVIGYLYEMDVQIPTLYVTRSEGTKYRSDAKSSLIIHRIKFSFGPLGVYSTTITRVGKPDYTETTELGLAGFLPANRLPIVEEIIETVPCYERNTNLKVNVKSSHPSPATLYSLAWEGDFTNRFYQRV